MILLEWAQRTYVTSTRPRYCKLQKLFHAKKLKLNGGPERIVSSEIICCYQRSSEDKLLDFLTLELGDFGKRNQLGDIQRVWKCENSGAKGTIAMQPWQEW